MYHFDEGAFELAQGYEDKTLHLFQKTLPGGVVLMTITREPKPADRTLESIGEQFVEEMSAKLRRFELVSHERGSTGALPAVRVRFRWFNPDGGPVYQEQVFVIYQEQVVVFSLASPERLADAAAGDFAKMMDSTKFRKKAT